MEREYINATISYMKDIIDEKIPTCVFERASELFEQIEEHNSAALMEALKGICTKHVSDFVYRMDIGETQDMVTPIREVLDLFDGYILTITLTSTNGRVRWLVERLTEKEVKEDENIFAK